jgi:hypothetical protein
MLKRSEEILVRRRAEAADAEASVLDDFGEAIAYLELLLAVGLGLGQSMIGEVEAMADEPEPYPESRARLVVTGHLWHRAASIGDEILALLKAGFTAAALARWRTMHELDVLTFVLGNSTYDGALEGLIRQEERDIAKFEGDWHAVRTDFPELLTGDYAWTDRFLAEADPKGYGAKRERQKQADGGSGRERAQRGPTFVDLQKAIGSPPRERQLYQAANGVIHGSWLTESLGSGKQIVMEDSENAVRLGMTATMSATGRTLWAITGTLTEVAEFAGAENRAEEHEAGEVLVALLLRALGVKEEGRILT